MQRKEARMLERRDATDFQIYRFIVRPDRSVHEPRKAGTRESRIALATELQNSRGSRPPTQRTHQ